MMLWESFVDTMGEFTTILFLLLLLVCIVGLIRALIGREHGKEG